MNMFEGLKAITKDVEYEKPKVKRAMVLVDDVEGLPQSDINGVSFDRATQKWKVLIKRSDGKRRSFGLHATREDAERMHHSVMAEYKLTGVLRNTGYTGPKSWSDTEIDILWALSGERMRYIAKTILEVTGKVRTTSGIRGKMQKLGIATKRKPKTTKYKCPCCNELLDRDQIKVEIDEPKKYIPKLER